MVKLDVCQKMELWVNLVWDVQMCNMCKNTSISVGNTYFKHRCIYTVSTHGKEYVRYQCKKFDKLYACMKEYTWIGKWRERNEGAGWRTVWL